MVDTSAAIDAIEPDDPRCWPALPLAQWADTCATLHRWSQIVGKVKLGLTPLVNHWWNVSLFVDARGLTTASSDSSTPSDATVAPTRTTGDNAAHLPCSTAVASGATLAARVVAPTAASAQTATSAYTANAMPSASGIARGIVRAGSATSSPSVAIRA